MCYHSQLLAKSCHERGEMDVQELDVSGPRSWRNIPPEREIQ